MDTYFEQQLHSSVLKIALWVKTFNPHKLPYPHKLPHQRGKNSLETRIHDALGLREEDAVTNVNAITVKPRMTLSIYSSEISIIATIINHATSIGPFDINKGDNKLGPSFCSYCMSFRILN